jgi:peptide/nickel transport system permease protein
MISLWVLGALYAAGILSGFLSPYSPTHDDSRLRYVAPQRIHLRDAGRWHRPFVRGLTPAVDAETGEVRYSEDATRHPVVLFARGDAWSLLWIPVHRHLFGSDAPVHLLGTDRQGRDLLSRILFGSRISLTVGLIGVGLSVLIGSFLGTLSGYLGGAVDTIVQRLIELLSSFPTIPLWMALAAALPATWTSLQIYLGMTVILSVLGWGGLARQVRGKVLAVREADFVMAARAAGAGPFYIARKHLLPTAAGHVIVTATLAIPGMILGETALSFLGLGIRPPLVSWGLLLEDAQRVNVLVNDPWLLAPALPIVVTVIAWNLIGEALRDAIDPYR